MVSHAATSRWFKLPPLPIGDGPDYDMLAFSINEGGLSAALAGDGLRINTGNPQWRAPYEAAASAAPDSSPSYADLLSAEPQKRVSTGRPPLFPVVVSLVYKVAGRGETGFAAVRTLLALSLAISVSLAAVMAALLVQRMAPAAPMWSPVVAAAITLLLGVTNNTLKTYSEDFLTEPLALLLMQAFVLSVLARDPVADQSSSTGARLSTAICAGLLLGLAILCRSMFVLWLPAIAVLAVLYKRSDGRSRFVWAAALISSAVLVCLPWWIRNYRVTDDYSPLGTKGMITLVGGYCDAALEAGGDWQFEPEQELRAELRAEGLTEQTAQPDSPEIDPFAAGTRFEVALAKRSRVQVMTWVRENSYEFAQLAWARIVTHWNPYSAKILLWRFACALGAVTLLMNLRRESWWLLGLPVTSTLVVACLYSVGGRFLVPIYGILFCLPSLPLALLWRSRDIRPSSPTVEPTRRTPLREH
ncbi:MAG: hypothetical protein Aurels2KO_52210 [Aureliella sp.]